jgi:hypothetical protein
VAEVTGVRIREYFETVNPEGDTIRVRFATDRGELLWYAVQFEVFVEGRYHPAVRYDAAHDYPHRDVLDWSGHVAEKTWLAPLPLRAAFDDALASAKRTWPQMRAEFFRRRP